MLIFANVVVNGFCQTFVKTFVLVLGLEVDFTFAWNNHNNHNNPHLISCKDYVLG